MRRRTFKEPDWFIQVNRTIQKIKKNSKSRTLKSYDIYECITIFIHRYLKDKVFSKSTIGNHYLILNLFHKWLNTYINITDIRHIHTSHLHKYFLYLRKKRNYKDSSLISVCIDFKRFFLSMKQRRIIKTNPFKDFNITECRVKKNVNLLTLFEIAGFISSVKAHYEYLKEQNKLEHSYLFIHRRDICILSLCIACGIRRGEITKIKINQIDFDIKSILISGKGNGKFKIKERNIFFSHPFLEKIIDKYYQMRRKLPGNNFFSNVYGDELTGEAIGCLFKKYSSFYNKSVRYNPTLTRKTFTSHLIKNKVNIEAAKRLLGHENCETTLEYYVHLSENDLKIIWKESNPYGN